MGPVAGADGQFWDMFRKTSRVQINRPWTNAIPKSTRIWIGTCASFAENMCEVFKERCKWESGACKPNDEKRPGAFNVFEPNILAFDSSERAEKCAELTQYDKEEQSWLVTCSPPGLGAKHNIFVNVSGRVVSSNPNQASWSFAKPAISSSLPRPYDAAGEIIIRGENLGGVIHLSASTCLMSVTFP